MLDKLTTVLFVTAWMILSSAPFLHADVNKANGQTIAGGSSYTPETAGFDGTNDYLSIGSDMTGASDGKTFTLSVWLDFTGGDGVKQQIFDNTGGRIDIYKDTSDQIQVYGNASGGATQLDMTSSVTKTASDGWFHLLVVIDTTTASSDCKFYFDGTNDASRTVTTFSTSNNIDITRGGSTIGADQGGNSKISASMADLWFDDTVNDVPGDYVDTGAPVDLGSDGSTPTGTAPFLYLSTNGSGDSWATDSSGNGNTHTVTGALDSPAAP